MTYFILAAICVVLGIYIARRSSSFGFFVAGLLFLGAIALVIKGLVGDGEDICTRCVPSWLVILGLFFVVCFLIQCKWFWYLLYVYIAILLLIEFGADILAFVVGSPIISIIVVVLATCFIIGLFKK